MNTKDPYPPVENISNIGNNEYSGELWTYSHNTNKFRKAILKFKNRVLSFTYQDRKNEYFLIIQNHDINIINNQKNPQYPYSLLISKDDLQVKFYSDDLSKIQKWYDILAQCSKNSSLTSNYNMNGWMNQDLSGKILKITSKQNNQTYIAKYIEKTKKNQHEKENPMNEINLLRKLDHPNIIKLHEVYEDSDYFILILEWIQGGDLLEKLLKKGPFNEQEAAYICYQLMTCLIYLEDNKILHRDIKLENILISPNNKKNQKYDYIVKLADFGLADYIYSRAVKFNIAGSPGYIAPEVFLDKGDIDYKSDLFSAGIVVFTLLTGSWAFRGKEISQIMMNNKKGEIIWNENKWKKISAQARELVSLMLSIDPKNRLSAKEVIQSNWIQAHCYDIIYGHRSLAIQDNIGELNSNDGNIDPKNLNELRLEEDAQKLPENKQSNDKTEQIRPRHKASHDMDSVFLDDELRSVPSIFCGMKETFQVLLEFDQAPQKSLRTLHQGYTGNKSIKGTQILQPYILSQPMTLSEINVANSIIRIDKKMIRGSNRIDLSPKLKPVEVKNSTEFSDFETSEENFDEEINENSSDSTSPARSLINLDRKPNFSLSPRKDGKDCNLILKVIKFSEWPSKKSTLGE